MKITNILAGIVAGATSALVFTIFHGLIISDIWFMLIPMLVAGAMCGFFLSWSYDLLVDQPSVAGWLRYNLLYIILLFVLGPISLVLFDPIMTIPELVSSPNGLPDELFREVLPLVAVYTPLMALFITALHGRRWTGYGVVLITCAVLVFLLGLNIAPMGLVFLTEGWVKMLLEMMSLVVALNLVYVVIYLLIGRFLVGETAVKRHMTT
jgi:hypothetical protein